MRARLNACLQCSHAKAALAIVRRDYREDIDWLRAIAVLAVVAFHFETPAVFGGFVGVDIFFVISGYLITGIIQSEVQERQLFLCALLRAPGAPAAARALRDGGADGDPVIPLSADLRTIGVLSFGRSRRNLHLEFLLLVSDRLFRPRRGGEAAAAHLVARGRGAVLSGAAAIAMGGCCVFPAAGALRCRSCSARWRWRRSCSASG